jgi:hypothetical protein
MVNTGRSVNGLVRTWWNISCDQGGSMPYRTRVQMIDTATTEGSCSSDERSAKAGLRRMVLTAGKELHQRRRLRDRL